MEFRFRNVNDAFRRLVTVFAAPGGPHVVRESSRNGDVLRIAEPVLITYEKPLERVLFNQARDANPFALLMEALWMIAGRNDVAPLTYYTKQFAEYSDDGRHLNGAYGYRWRHAQTSLGDDSVGPDNLEVDQLDLIVAHLKAQPNSRRAVLSMWDVREDLLKIGPEPFSRDICCNLNVMFSLRKVHQSDYIDPALGPGPHPAYATYLDMTVTNRSNDLVWGLLGANYVCFSVLLEYMAARLGAGVGRYHHFSNNLHVYDDSGNPKVAPWEPAKWLADKTPDWYNDSLFIGECTRKSPLVNDPETFEHEVKDFVELFSGKQQAEDLSDHWDEPFLMDVAQPMLVAWACHKVRDYHGAFACLAGVEDDAWRLAGEAWMRRRMEKYESKAKEATDATNT